MPLILGTNSIKDTGYDVANSLRFNSGSSDYLNRTPSSAGTQTKATISVWFKRSNLSSNQAIFSTGSNNVVIKFATADKIGIYDFNGSSMDFELNPSMVFRDTSAWYHIVVSLDSTQSTSSDRAKLYINGSLISDFDSTTYPSQNYNFKVNGTLEHFIGRLSGLSQYFNGYMAEFVNIDGTALDPTSFGEFDSDTNIWKPKDVSGLTFGTNGFYLDFKDSSALGNDANGSNNFTVNNLTAIDQSTDTCTNNFATLNPLYHYIDSATLSEGNLKFTTSGNSSKGRAISTIRPESGKWYVECKIIDVTRFQIGIMNGNETNSAQGGSDTNSVILGYNGDFYFNSSQYTNYIADPSNNDIVQLALDLDNDLFWFGVNDTWGNSATRTEIENGTATNSGSTDIGSQVPVNTGAIGIFLEDNSGTGNNVTEINFGSPSFSISSGNTDGNGYGNFEYAVPSGYYSLNTKNLAEYG